MAELNVDAQSQTHLVVLDNEVQYSIRWALARIGEVRTGPRPLSLRRRTAADASN
ncbi:hypothetical protein ACIQ9P_12410 [Kitasatospora sp. NPDC094019]|uniref:hypothetical protein n=1 Tax=Kitasatospora sp. NPDC094019 TaxID=3364091 RepID=UPI003814E5F3